MNAFVQDPIWYLSDRRSEPRVNWFGFGKKKDKVATLPSATEQAKQSEDEAMDKLRDLVSKEAAE